jgi:hypothetical protein
LSLNPNGSFIYTPNPNYNGADSFSYAAHDGVVAGNVATVSIQVNPVNDPPVATNDSYTTAEDVPLNVSAPGILANDTDVEGDALTAALVNNVSNGHLSFNSNGSFTYTPNPNYYGSDSFNYRASDGAILGNLATVTINVTPVSDPLQFTWQQMAAEGFKFNISNPDLSTYVISISTNLRDWTPILTNYSTGNLTFTDTSATNNPLGFYRAELR